MPSAYAESKKDSKSTRDDIGGLMAELSKRPHAQERARKLTGPERAAVLMLSLGEQYGAKIFSLLDDDELREISIVMSSLGTIEAESVEQLLLEFVSRMSASGALLGNYDATERLEQTLRTEFMSNLSQTRRRDAHEVMAEIFNNFDRQTETRFLTALEEDN